MKNIIRVAQRAVCAFGIFGSLLLSNSCTDEVNNGIIPEDLSSGVSIFIPNISGAVSFANSRSDFNSSTRAEVEVTETESTINNIYLVAFQGDDIFKVVKINKTGSSVEGDYTEYGKVNLPKGNYRFYLLANLDSYLPEGKSSVDKITDKSEIENLILNFGNDQGLSLAGDNLPMFCLPKDIKTSIDDSSKLGTDGTFEITEDENGGKIYADLTFLCSKVRYTILFNNNPDGISYKFGDNYIDFATNEGAPHFATNIRQSTALELSSEVTSSSFIQKGGNLYNHSLSLGKYKYPEKGDEYGIVEDENSTPDNDLTENFSETTNSQIAWQGYFYIPENITIDPTDQTTLTFSGVVKSPDGSTIDSETFANRSVYVQGSGEKEGKGNVRGKYYDIVSKVTSGINNDLETTVSVSNWTTENLTYKLQGDLELEVQRTEIKVSTNNWTILGYNANKEVSWNEVGLMPKYEDKNFYEIEYISPKTVNEKGELYEFKDGYNNHIRVKVNPEISLTKLNELKKSEEINNYLYFHLAVGNLKKKISVTLDEVKPVLEVSPLKITLNVRELTGSFIDNGKIDIAFSTNVDVNETSNNLTLTSDNTNNILNTGGVGNGALSLDIPSGIKSGDNIIVSSGKISLNYKEILDGNSYWNNRNTYTFKFTLKVEGDSDIEKTVTIEVIPFTSDYVIHFKCKQGLWTNPHIYVYQCLEMPLDYSYKIPNEDNAEISAAGLTVGYKDGERDTDLFAALEYLFSNNISFRGWDGYGGNVEYKKNGSVYKSGFVHIGGFDDNLSRKFKPANKNIYYYDYETDLNTRHFSEKIESGENRNWYCPDCLDASKLNEEGARGWPGVAMVYEGNGWWKYTLSGIATPGKAMIMFTNSHNEVSSNAMRYPMHSEVGVPLFDFPDNEGWFLYDASLKYNSSTRNYIHSHNSQGFNNNYSYQTGITQEFPGEPDDLYIRGEMAFKDEEKWIVAPEYRFFKVRDNEWRTGFITFKEDEEFKIGNADWSISISGSGKNRWLIKPGTDFELENNGDCPNMYYNDGVRPEFQGYAILKKTGDNTYTLRLESY